MAAGRLTEALVRLHGAGRADTYGAALLDVAQDHLLWLLTELGHFDDGTLLFKGGTALRKCRLGSAGRFSTDLDFVAPDDDTVLEGWERVVRERFEFLAALDEDERRWARCDQRHRHEIETVIDAGGFA